MDKYLVFGDIHLNSKTNISDLCDIIDSFNPKYIIFLGDFFDDSYGIRKNDLKNAYNFIRKINTSIYILTGNHDSFGNDSYYNNIFRLYGFDLINNIKIISQNSYYIEGNKVYIGYFYNIEKFKEALNEIKTYINNNKYHKYYIFSHNDISEFYLGTPKQLFPSIIDIFKEIDKKVYFISGHIHDEFFYSYSNVKIISVGNFYNNNFRDKTLVPNILVINDDIIELYKYYSDNFIYKKFNVNNIEDINKILSFLSLYRYTYKKIHISTNNIDILNYLKNFFIYNNDLFLKNLNIKYIKISSNDEEVYESIEDNLVLIDNNKIVNINDEIYDIINNYVNIEYKNKDEVYKNNKIDSLLNKSIDLLNRIINKS